jgi:hypothetical protein
MRKNEEYLQSTDEGVATSSISPCPNPFYIDYASMESHLWDHKFGVILNLHLSIHVLYVSYEIIGFIPPIFSCTFHHEKASFYKSGEAQHFRDIWDKLRIPLLQLWIFPKIMP